ncbi:CDP-diacylglycerol--glycerol-3-phosphate 3-phosphatidyltransferase [Candidatus Photodesmus katoptron]|uniref:CDP-diacylglycerol--glycerol-3-phosphate 3-phosphatidyltransferase n=1 Tax=Candidatus Photodesmus katoptron Akat1 TaxID=1236703 RepID=S3E0G9_9GAMM|nr:CDP-diacylglycerol--glycerol-3-phosphate 3-phosphatidyltransferase [Candidatus Photodesmus katoptron]EPE37681.1 CDP-diacylglycerol--glycerol-3-phosphate 3-phosphatidyltransferase [Candidatus Photodesmus katoptron Akat1]KEY90598.1 CDP-diacylglycerol--glycerol-3-phosphate 3-phosphatidyltransferase [Candidatus Photodesmus katoptron]
MRFNIPNILSLLRIFLIPIFVVIFYLPHSWAPFAASIVFWGAGFTDWLDGMLARRLDQISRFGAFIDPVADKILVITALILITESYHNVWITIPSVVMISREIIISALREWMAEIGKRVIVSVSNISKIKTLNQMSALWLLIWSYNEWMIWIGYIAMYIAMILTCWSMIKYLVVAMDNLFREK